MTYDKSTAYYHILSVKMTKESQTVNGSNAIKLI